MARYQRGQTMSFQHRRTDFKLCIFSEDYIRIGKLVSKIPYAETGGNLFGLWTNQGNAVVLVATGPGKNCKRSSASFYQDIPYMQRVGELLTGEYPLCHIGEWHSHHQMQLYEPSFGDCNTVQQNYPRGSQGFVLVIANILYNGTVKISPYKFTDEKSPYEIGTIEVLSRENPFMKVRLITRAIEDGKEERIPQLLGTFTDEYSCLLDENQNDKDKNPKRNYPPSPTITRSNSPNKKTRRLPSLEGQTDHSRQEPTEHGDVHRSPLNPSPPSLPRKQPNLPINRASKISGVPGSPSTISHSRKEKLQDTSVGTAEGGQHHKFTARNSMTHPQERSQLQTEFDIYRYRTTQWYETQDILITTLNFVKSLADDQETVNISRDETTLNMTMLFTHHNSEWAIDFPTDFPRGSVNLKQRLVVDRAYSYSVEGLGDIDSFNTELKSTLRKKCKTCKLSQQEPLARNLTANRQERSQVRANEDISRCLKKQWYETKPDALRKTMDFVQSLADDQYTVDISRDKTTPDITATFTHHNYQWSIDFPSDFPKGSVKLKKLGSCVDTYIVEGRGDLDTFKVELQSIFQNHCTRCWITRSNYIFRYS